MRQSYIMGNWKMNGSIERVQSLLSDLLQGLPTTNTSQCVVFPPAIYLPLADSILKQTGISLGAQNVYPSQEGAFTGELSGPMLKEYNCQYVLVGHSERRHLFQESEKFVAEKFHHVQSYDMIPVLCVGETAKERENGLMKAVLTKQLEAIAAHDVKSFRRCVLAYEPVWAIGSGCSASPSQAQEAHQLIRECVTNFDPEANKTSILYGGSLNPNNAAAIFSQTDVDGGLVGGASLEIAQFLEIAKCINYY